ncbi:hypothetical protein [Microbacterium aquimaris]|uniref:Uncharacterized protein n=1 Tax=Microbacterium aquimaris TaxID=459816 RepID=A0ABU5N8L0_9MICO|nr:hypothetical protein [Microbacterium aquimaris]MDZ8162342.1 hypothetical protein [Microbacterium aquimaris]
MDEASEGVVGAIEKGRRELLVAARLRIAQVIDDGAPAHALARLVTELDRLDGQIRVIDEEDTDWIAHVQDEPFDPSSL